MLLIGEEYRDMGYYRLINRISGNLVDISDYEFPSERFGDGLVQDYIEGEIPDLRMVRWNASSQSFENCSIRILSKLEFLTRFTINERVAARASVDPIVQDFLRLLDIAEFVNLDDSTTQQALGYISSLGILTPERVQEIIT